MKIIISRLRNKIQVKKKLDNDSAFDDFISGSEDDASFQPYLTSRLTPVQLGNPF